MLPLLLLLACSGEPTSDPGAQAGEEGAATSEADAARAALPDIVLVAVDTLRADHLGAYGYPRPTSPNIDALAAKGTRFHRAYAQSGWTLTSFTSLMTGLYPHQHRVGRDPYDVSKFGRLPDEVTTLAEVLKARGYRTKAIVSNTFVAPEFKLNQGFDTYDFKGATNDQHRLAPEAVAEALEWLSSSEEPAFLWLHLMEPHLDYMPPETQQGQPVKGTFWTGEVPPAFVERDGIVMNFPPRPDPVTPAAEAALDYVVARYDEEILATDIALGTFFAGLESRPRWDRTHVVFTSDHGEEFWDHGGFEHGHTLYGELTRVPLIAVGPGVEAGGVVTTVVEHVDLFQGLVALAGGERPAGSSGEDLYAIARERPDERGRASLSGNCLYGPPRISLVNDTHRLVLDQHRQAAEAWVVAADGSELLRLEGEAQRQVALPMLAELERRRGTLDPLESVAGPQVPGSETFSQLAALGYLDDLPAEDQPEAMGEDAASEGGGDGEGGGGSSQPEGAAAGTGSAP